MNIFKKLFGTNDGAAVVSEAELLEAGACPNCWGKQDYDGEFVAFVEDKTKANINHDHSSKKAFIQQFVETNITGIHLKKDGEAWACPSCQKKF